ncbi:hypothetical protein BWI97_26930 [Siphonobacter sp. BAB-5405]|nr:hypothetical protein BWI97_26930 [Siphonobacter sp. BAB-5405]
MAHVPAFAQELLRQLPNQWEDVKFIDGYPGKLCVVARRSGKRWYVAGINGEAKEKELKLDLSFLSKAKATLITDGEPMFTQQSVTPSNATVVTVKANGGFVLVTE